MRDIWFAANVKTRDDVRDRTRFTISCAVIGKFVGENLRMNVICPARLS